ncbi:hypothetical protein AAIH25_03480 [Arthrobacter crystallopoietes]|nr:hypothetical protein [Arthrobacter sp. Marseille-P9274]
MNDNHKARDGRSGSPTKTKKPDDDGCSIDREPALKCHYCLGPETD